MSFRISEDEYKALLGTSMARGARSISDFARLNALQPPGENNGDGWEAVHAEIKALNGQINRIDSELKRLADLLQTTQQPA